MIDLSSSMDEPLSSGPMSVCDNENYRSCANEVNLTATREGLTSFTKQMGELVTDIIHDAGDELEKENQFSEFDLSKFIIKTEISGIQAPDGVVSDDQAITLKLSIPEVTFTLGVDASTADLQSGNTDNIRISVVTSYLQSLFVQPMQSIGSTLVRGIQYSFISSSGLTFPAEGEQAQTYRTGVINTTIYNDAQLSLTGPMSFTLPRGVQLVDVSSTSGNLIVTEDGSRQTVTYIIPPGEFEDEITYRIHIGWMYFLIQFWIYPAIVLFLLVMFIRRRRRKKKEKKARKARQEQGIAKMQLGDDAFADLTGFASPGLRAGETIEDMASVDQY